MENEVNIPQPVSSDETTSAGVIRQVAGDYSTQIVAINSTVTHNNQKYTIGDVTFNFKTGCGVATITVTYCTDTQFKLAINVQFSDLRQLEELSEDAKQVLKKYDCEKEFGQWVKRYIIQNGGEHYAIMAKSLLDSCKPNQNATPNDGVKEQIKNCISNEGKKKFCVFLSAITSIERQNTIEYYAAKYISFALKKCGIGVFWWENDDFKNEEWFVSSKIATGLALSSIFVCLAYDSVQVQSNGTVNFTCFDGEMSPCFKYEYETYKSFLFDSKAGDTSSSFDKFTAEFNSDMKLFPTVRKLRVFSYGVPSSYVGCNAVFNNSNDEIITTNIITNNDIKHKIKLIFNSVISEIFNIISSDNSFKELCPKVKSSLLKGKKSYKTIEKLWKKADKKLAELVDGKKRNYVESEYSYLYSAFDPMHFSNGKYCDGFLGPEWSGSNTFGWMINGSKENIEAVPMDYSFQYAIVDNAGRNAKNHFLVFPERYNDKKGNFRWRIKLVIRDWNLRAIKDSEYRRYLVDSDGDGEPIKKPTVNEHYPLTRYSAVEFYNGVSDVSAVPSFSDEFVTCQRYSDNRVGSRTSQINVGNDNHCAFIIYDDMLNEIRPTYSLNGLLKLCDSDSPNDCKYFYISLNFYPKSVVYSTRKVKLRSFNKLKEFETRCPYCGRIKTNDKKYGGGESSSTVGGKKKGIDYSKYCYSETILIGNKSYCSCEYNFIGRVYSLTTSGVMKKGPNASGESDNTVYGNFTGDEFKGYKGEGAESDNSLISTDSSGMKRISNPGSRLLYEDYYKDGIVVTMVGISRSGKSTFLSRMLSVHSDGEYKGNILCEYLNNAMQPYVEKVTPMPVKTKEMIESCRETIPNNYGISGIRLLEDYISPKYQGFLQSTQNENYDPIITHIPFGIELKGIQNNSTKKSFVSFFDLPGGLFSTTEDHKQKTLPNLHNDYTMLYRSDSIILLVDDEQKNEEELKSLLTAIDKCDKEKTIVAIVFCKADKLFSKQQYLWDYIRRSSPAAKDNKFEGSKRQTYIDKCSEEIAENMARSGSATINGIMDKLKDYKKRKFFAISALGRGDSIICGDNDEKYTLYETAPLNIENVLLWIMFERRIIE